MGAFGARGLELADEAEPLEFGEGAVEAVLDASFVDEEAVEDAWAGEVLDGDPSEVHLVAFRLVVRISKSFLHR